MEFIHTVRVYFQVKSILCNHRFKVHSRPLDIIYKQSLLAQIKEMLMEPLTDHKQTTVSAGLDRLEDHSRSTLSDKLGQLLGGGAKVKL